MARVFVTAEESAFIAARIASFATEAPEPLRWQSPYVERFVALPVYIGWTDTIGLRSDGELVRCSTEGDYVGFKPEDDVLWIRIALVQGAKRYSELRRLITPKPPTAHECPDCGGTGQLPALPQVICRCGGVGWLD